MLFLFESKILKEVTSPFADGMHKLISTTHQSCQLQKLEPEREERAVAEKAPKGRRVRLSHQRLAFNSQWEEWVAS